MGTVTRTTLTVVLGIAAVVLLVALFGRGGGVVTATPAADGTVRMVMEERAFAPTDVTIVAGRPVTFEFVNRDVGSHMVSFGRAVVEEDQRAVGFGEDLLAGLDVDVRPSVDRMDVQPPYRGTTIMVQGGETVSVTFTVPPERRGDWQIGCFTSRGCDYRTGMAAALHVE
ncbi:hypothetical protein [Egicoccus sp. AB-alg2]|uniref:hypothetical protein n=1 Tax=Egicoccus sp. AB-alg2 TaxID=3242693 RepID=UPI00359EC753